MSSVEPVQTSAADDRAVVLFVDGVATTPLEYLTAAAGRRDSDAIIGVLRDLSKQLPDRWTRLLIEIRNQMTDEDAAVFMMSHVHIEQDERGARAHFDYPPGSSEVS